MPFYYYNTSYWIILIPAMLISLIAQIRVSTTFQRWSRVSSQRNLTGAHAAEAVLRFHGVYDVRIEHVSGRLSDHYDPHANVIRLSDAVYNVNSVAAVGVAAHEAGHAVQYAQGYTPIRVRSAIIPLSNIGSQLSIIFLLIGLFLYSQTLFGIGVLLFSLAVICQLVTLPVEFNASRRAIVTLEQSGLLDQPELRGAKKVLSAAAMTYVAALLVSLAQLLRFLLAFGSRRRGLIVGNNSARETALLVLSACAKQGAWSDVLLKKSLREAKLDNREAALATRLCFGVLQNRILLDFYLAGLCSMQLKKLEERVLESLRLGAYQILFLERIPDCAAVNESVELARKYAKNPRAAGFVNGVLRSLIRQKDQLPQPPNDAVRYSHPDWLAECFIDRLGNEEAAHLMELNNMQPPTYAQVNTCRFTSIQVQKRLTEQGVEVLPHPWLSDCLLLNSMGNLEQLELFQEGAFYIQDPAAHLAVLAADLKPGMQILDACAAPGGKSFAAAVAIGDQGSILSCDIHPHKQRLIEAGSKRLGLHCIQAQTLDAKICKEEFLHRFDLVIADVPCSGLGIIRKKPDIRYKDSVPLEHLPQVQTAILENVSAYVKPGGQLLYATCTLLKQENEEVVKTFLDRHSDFTIQSFQLPEPIGCIPEGMLTLWPHIHHTDGFFLARMQRKESVT